MENNIDINKIMEDIRREIIESGADKIPLSFEEKKENTFSTDGSEDLAEALEYIASNYEVNCYQTFMGNPIKVFIKKVLRKMSSFFVLPIVGQQNQLNARYYSLLKEVLVQRKQLDILEKRNNELEEIIKQYEERNR